MNDRSPVDPMQPDMLQKLDKYMKPLIRPFVYKWAITQVIKLDVSHIVKYLLCTIIFTSVHLMSYRSIP